MGLREGCDSESERHAVLLGVQLRGVCGTMDIPNKETHMKMVISAVASLLIPGLGQLFHGKLLWAVGWFLSILMLGPLANLMSAGHAAFISAK